MKYCKHDILKIEFIEDALISDITTYKTYGKIKGVFFPKNERELIMLVQFLNENALPFKIVGNGSNLLISPKSNILFVSTKKMKQTSSINKNIAVFSASISLSKAYSLCLANNLRGLEKLAGIPASIGGAIKNNASAFGNSIFDYLESVRIFKDGEVKLLKKDDVTYSYHSTNLDGIILSAKFKFPQDKQCKIMQDFIYYSKLRSSLQPKGFCCGSVFKNPPSLSAGKLIEDCNLKGLSKGNATISQRHGNFIINNGNASFFDVLYLIEKCEEEVFFKYDIKLEREVEIIE